MGVKWAVMGSVDCHQVDCVTDDFWSTFVGEVISGCCAPEV